MEPAVEAFSGAAFDAGPSWVVSRWLDYSSKYGMGVVLENRKSRNRHILAVYFNDSTKMCADLDEFRYATYFVRYRGQADQRLTLRIAEDDHQDPDIRKKLILIRNFKVFILSENPKEGTERGRSVLPKFPTSGACEEDVIHLRKYVRTRQALVFVLSNKTQHVMFVDGSEDEVALKSGLEVSVAMPKFSAGVRSFRLTDDIRDERLRRRVNQAVAIINGLGFHQPHGGCLRFGFFQRQFRDCLRFCPVPQAVSRENYSRTGCRDGKSGDLSVSLIE
jgi:hypothetical protein